MAEYNGNTPTMNWQAVHLHKEWNRFQQHCTFTFNGPLATKTEAQNVNYLMTYIGVKYITLSRGSPQMKTHQQKIKL